MSVVVATRCGYTERERSSWPEGKWLSQFFLHEIVENVSVGLRVGATSKIE